MEKNKKGVTYKREKDKIEISGDADQLKGLMWFDLISSRFVRVILIIMTIIFACVSIKAGRQIDVWQWLKKNFGVIDIFCGSGEFSDSFLISIN